MSSTNETSDTEGQDQAADQTVKLPSVGPVCPVMLSDDYYKFQITLAARRASRR